MRAWQSPLLILGMLLIFAAGGAVLAPFVIDWDNYRSEIEAYGRKLTGREVTIVGDISARLFPWPALRIGEFRIANPAASALPDLLSAEGLEVRMDLTPLLSGDLQIESMHLTRPFFGFERMASGVGTWALTPLRGLDTFISAEKVIVSGITIEQGTVYLRDGKRGGIAEISELNATVSAPELTGPWRLRGTAAHDGLPVELSLSTGRIRENEPVRLALRVTPGTVGGFVYSFDGMLPQRTGANIEGVLKAVPKELPAEYEESGGLTPQLQISANLAAGFDMIKLTEIEIAPADPAKTGNVITGRADIDLGLTLEFDIKLHAGLYDLDGHSEYAVTDLIGSGSALSGLAHFVDQLPDDIIIGLDLALNSVIADGETLRNFRLRTEAQSERLRVYEISAVLPGQTRASFTGDLLSGEHAPQISGSFELSARSARDLSYWVLPSQAGALKRIWTGAGGGLLLSGEIDATADQLRLSNLDFVLDQAKGSGALSASSGDSASLTARLVVDELNLDRYAPNGVTLTAVDAGAVAGALDLVRRSLALDNFGLSLRADRLTLHGVTAADISVDTIADGQSLNLRTVEIADVGGSRLSMTGYVRMDDDQMISTVSTNINAQDARELLQLFALTEQGDTRWGKLLSPLDVQLVSEVTAGPLHTDAEFGLFGNAGLFDGTVRLSFSGDVNEWQDGIIKATSDVNVTSAEAVSVLTGWPMAAGEGGGSLKFTAQGTPVNGLATDVDMELFGSQLRFSGMLASTREDAFSADGRLAVMSETPGPIYTALGVVPASGYSGGNGLAAEGPFSYRDNSYRWAGLRGSVAGVDFSGDLALDYDEAGVPILSGGVETARISLPWLLSMHLFDLNRGGPGMEEPFAAARDGVLRRELDITASSVEVLPGMGISGGRISLTGDDKHLALEVIGDSSEASPARIAFDFTRNTGNLAVTGDVSMTSRLSDVLTMASGVPVTDAALGVDATFNGSGRTPAGLLSSLFGQGRYRLHDGTLFGVNAQAFASSLTEARGVDDVDNAVANELGTGAMPFTGGSGDIVIAGGIARFSEIEIMGLPAAGRLSGLVELPTASVELSARLALADGEDAPAFDVAYAGPASAVTRSVDVEAIKSKVNMDTLTKGIDRLEQLQREQERVLREEYRQQRKEAMQRLQLEHEMRQRAVEERARAKAEAAAKAREEEREKLRLRIESLFNDDEAIGGTPVPEAESVEIEALPEPIPLLPLKPSGGRSGIEINQLGPPVPIGQPPRDGAE